MYHEQMMLRRFLHFSFAVFLAFALPQPCAAEPLPVTQEEPPLTDDLPQSIIDKDKTNFFTFVLENDMFGNGTDSNYTNGLRLSYFNVNADFPDIAHRIAALIPTFDINRTSSIFYSLGQNLYTPDNISSPVMMPGDRPWAAHLYGAVGMATLTGRHLDEIEASLGVVGPWALGKQAQRFIHKHVSDSPTPRGWHNQIKNEPALMLGWQRRWPAALTASAGGFRFSAAPHIGLTLGNVHTFANTGFGFRIAPERDRWQDAPARVRPAMPGTGYFEIPEKGWSWFLFGGVDTRAVARNIFLDGNSFRNSPNVSKNYFIADSSLGLALTFQQFRISYTLNHRSKSYKMQKEDDLFGAVSLNYRF